MGMLLTCGDGLLQWDGVWRRMPCPLSRPSLVACTGSHVAAVDNAAHLLWHQGALLPCPREVTALHLWQQYALVLSSDTGCLSIADRDGWLVTAPVGADPQGMCLRDDEALVCGGADGLIYHLSLPELHTLHRDPTPGIPEQISAAREAAYILCTEEDAPLHTSLCRLEFVSGAFHTLARLPGLPGAVHAAPDGSVWVSTSERLYRFLDSAREADLVVEGFALAEHIALQDHDVMVTDPSAGLCVAISQQPDPAVTVLYRGQVGGCCIR